MPKTKPPMKAKPYSQMTTAELRHVTRRFDDPAYQPPTQPMTPEDRKMEALAESLAAVAKRGGRPRIGLGAERVQIALERGLLAAAGDYARRHKLSRSKLIAEALKMFLAHAA